MRTRLPFGHRSALLGAAIFALLAATAALADDRDLLKSNSSDPYVMILFDTSGSMNFSAQCTTDQVAAGDCSFECPTGDCFTPLSGDDPASKFYQAKEALFEVLEVVEGVNFGFATYNQNALQVSDKHWLYEVSPEKPDTSANNSITLASGATFPTVGNEEVFGYTWNCDDGSGFNEAGCHGSSGKIADMNDADELRRAGRLPKLGRETDWSGVGRYLDEFTAVSYSNDDGTLASGTSWFETRDDTLASSGQIQVTGGDLRISNQWFLFPEVVREFDLSAFPDAELSFTIATDAGVTFFNDWVTLEISPDGGATWVALDYFLVFGPNESHSVAYDISAYRSSNTQIKFRVDLGYYFATTNFFVDDLTVTTVGTSVYLRDNNDGERYKVTYRPAGDMPAGAPTIHGTVAGDKIAVDVEVRRCTDDQDACANEPRGWDIVYFDLVSDFVSFDVQAQRDPPLDGFFFQGRDGSALDTCDGWDPTDDTADDTIDSYSLRFPTTEPDLLGPPRWDIDGDGIYEPADGDTHTFELGDIVPWDWEDDHADLIQLRLAPNLVNDAMATPDYRVANYLADDRGGGETFLRLKDDTERPLFPNGATPLGASMENFRDWYGAWEAIANQPDFDDDFNCRAKFLIVLTDGDETCDFGKACDPGGEASMLLALGIKTFVVAYGVAGGSANDLECMADEGGTGDPVYPQNKQELIDALTSLFDEIKASTRAFASASVPTVQNETSDKIFLSSFTPLADVAKWPGRIDAFRRPLPLNDDNTPDFDRVCVDPITGTALRQAACHLWNAGEELLDQAPDQSDVDLLDFKIGLGQAERRIYYGQEASSDAVPAPLRAFDIPPTADEYDLWEGFGLAFTVGDSVSEDAARDRAQEIMKETLKIKEETAPDPAGGPDLEFEYVLGDIFHSDPIVISSPNNLIYFREDPVAGHGYEDFSRRHFWRRKMVAVAANDGMVHFFDAGVRIEFTDPVLNEVVETFTDGDGSELFAYMPRMAMPIVRDQAEGDKHIYSLDGRMATGDVFIDPLHDGSNNDPDDRGWRTVLMGSMREAGDVFRESNPVTDYVSGYWALDITQPDELTYPSSDPLVLDPLPYPNVSPGDPPNCLQFDSDGDPVDDSDCPTPAGSDFRFPTELWSFTDQAPRSLGGPYYLDEESGGGNGYRDLGDTWSKPIIVRIEVCTGTTTDCLPASDPNKIEDRYVAIIGGGIDPTNPDSSQRGSWIYMIDFETGKAIYKRQVDGGIAGAPAVIDDDQDGYVDFFYVATTTGYIYKVDLALNASGEVPGFTDVTIDDSRVVGSPLGAGTSDTVSRVTDAAWEPFQIFYSDGRPFFMTPTVFLVPDLDQYAIAIGTGNRENLWEKDGVTEGRFYAIVDEDFTTSTLGLPNDETDYDVIDDDDPDTITDLLAETGHRGWVLKLNVDEKVITQAFVLVGVLVFTAFDPDETTSGGTACARSGVSRIFVLNAENADAIVTTTSPPPGGGSDRYTEVSDFTTSPYVQETATKNPEDDSGERTSESVYDSDQEELQEAIRQSLMRFFPEGCRYDKSVSLRVNASKSDTGHVRFATIPVAMCPVDWTGE